MKSLFCIFRETNPDFLIKQAVHNNDNLTRYIFLLHILFNIWLIKSLTLLSNSQNAKVIFKVECGIWWTLMTNLWHIVWYSNSCYGEINAVAIVLVGIMTLHTVAIVNYMLLLIIWLLVFCDFVGIISFEIYKSS